MKQSKQYGSYKEYLAHQREKTLSQERIKKEHDNFDLKVDRFRRMFELHLHAEDMTHAFPPDIRNAACLGSRSGSEVKALHDMGINAVGFDLVPFPPYTEQADVHSVPLQEKSVQLTFTNIFDHVLYPQQFADEIVRITQWGGFVLMQLPIGRSGDKYRCYDYDHVEDVVQLFRNRIDEDEPVDVLRVLDIPKRGSINTEVLLQL